MRRDGKRRRGVIREKEKRTEEDRYRWLFAHSCIQFSSSFYSCSALLFSSLPLSFSILSLSLPSFSISSRFLYISAFSFSPLRFLRLSFCLSLPPSVWPILRIIPDCGVECGRPSSASSSASNRWAPLALSFAGPSHTLLRPR